MSILISRLGVGGANTPDYVPVNTVSPPGTFRATVAAIRAATGSRPAGSVNPTKVAPGTHISGLPVLSTVYQDDLIMVDQGTPPITRAVSIGVASNWTGNPANNTESSTPPNQSVKISGLPLTLTPPSGRDYTVINQGNPPKTRRVLISDLLPQSASLTTKYEDTFTGAATPVYAHAPDTAPTGFTYINEGGGNLALDGFGNLVMPGVGTRQAEALYTQPPGWTPVVLGSTFQVEMDVTMVSDLGSTSGISMYFETVDGTTDAGISISKDGADVYNVAITNPDGSAPSVTMALAGFHTYSVRFTAARSVLSVDGVAVLTSNNDNTAMINVGYLNIAITNGSESVQLLSRAALKA